MQKRPRVFSMLPLRYLLVLSLAATTAYAAKADEPTLVAADPITVAVPIAFSEYYAPGRAAWYFQVEAIALKRDPAKNMPLAVFAQRTWTETENPKWDERYDPQGEKYIWVPSEIATTLLELRDINPSSFQGGKRFLIGRTLPEESAFEVSYFDVANWSGRAVVYDDTPYVAAVEEYTGVPTTVYPASLFSPLSDFGGVVGLDYNRRVFASYSSSLSNLEWNFRRYFLRAPGYFHVAGLFGGRYMQIGETFGFDTESAVATHSITTDTHNTILGLQIGTSVETQIDPGWWLNCEVKGVLFNNAANQRTAYKGVYTGSAGRDAIGGAVDATFTATLPITRRVAINVGYQLLYVTSLALASENFSPDVNILTSGPATVVTDGSAFYHGLHLGVSCVW